MLAVERTAGGCPPEDAGGRERLDDDTDSIEVLGSDHHTVCQPTSMNDSSYVLLVRHIKERLTKYS